MSLVIDGIIEGVAEELGNIRKLTSKDLHRCLPTGRTSKMVEKKTNVGQCKQPSVNSRINLIYGQYWP
jgi:hypothetical protein